MSATLFRVGAEPVGENAARRASANNDKVELFAIHCRFFHNERDLRPASKLVNEI